MASKRNPFEDWLAEVVSDMLVTDDSVGGLEREAMGNLWAFSISQDQSRAVTGADVLVFLSAVGQARDRQIRERFGAARTMVFYCWFEEQSSQLRLSLVSARHNRLPFGAQSEVTDDLGRVVRQFLRSPYHEGLPLEEFVPQDLGDGSGTNKESGAALLVWTKILPTGERNGQTLPSPKTSKTE